VASLNIRALMKAAGVSFAVYVLIYGCNLALTSALSGSLSAAVPPDETALLGMMAPALILGCLSYLLYLAYGALYGFFAQREGDPADIGIDALGGALTGLIVAVVGTIIGSVASFAVSMVSISSMDLPSEVGAPDMMGIMGVGLLINLVIGLCIAVVLGSGLAAAGGAIYGAVARSQTPAPPAF
jgi:hypothetical protein